MSSSPRPSILETRHLLFILLIYFFICFPLSQIYLKNSTFLYKNWNLFFHIITLTTLFAARKINITKIGLSNFSKKNLFLGLILVLLPIMAVVILDILIVKTGMAENNLFSGAELRNPVIFSNGDLLIKGFLNPIVSQLFITGYALNILIRRNDSMLIPGNGILYSLISLDFGMGYLGMGVISASLAKLAGNLLPAVAFNTGCSLAKILILTTYPRITTVLVFLV